MTPGRRANDGGHHPLGATFTRDTQRLFVHENGEGWTVGRLLAYAGDIERATPPGAGRLVAVRSHSAAFVIAALLGLWKAGRCPLLVDPALTSEPAGLRTRGERIPVIAPAGVADPWSDVAVTESRGEPVPPGFPRPDACEVAFFTSGSTGEPKTIRKKASQLAEQFTVEAPWLGIGTGVSTLCLVPAFHILGYIYGFYWPGASAGTAVFNRVQSPQQWIDKIRERRPNLVVGVPAHYRLITQMLSDALPPAIYLCSGAPLDPAICDQFQRRAGSPVHQVYGSTETGGIATRIGSGPWRPFPTLAWQVREADGRLLVRSRVAGCAGRLAPYGRCRGGGGRHVPAARSGRLRGEDRRTPVLQRRDRAGRARRAARRPGARHRLQPFRRAGRGAVRSAEAGGGADAR